MYITELQLQEALARLGALRSALTLCIDAVDAVAAAFAHAEQEKPT